MRHVARTYHCQVAYNASFAPWLLCILSYHVIRYLTVSCLTLAIQVSVGILDGLSAIGWLVYLPHSPGECACVFILPLC